MERKIDWSRFPKLSLETWVALGAASVVALGVTVSYAMQKRMLQPQEIEVSPETALLQGEARRLLSVAVQQTQNPQVRDCYQKDPQCVLNRFRRESTERLAGTYAVSPEAALNAYTRLKALDEVTRLQNSPEQQSIEHFLKQGVQP